MTTNNDLTAGYSRVRLPDAIAEGAWFERPWSGLYSHGWGRAPSDVNKIPANYQRVAMFINYSEFERVNVDKAAREGNNNAAK